MERLQQMIYHIIVLLLLHYGPVCSKMQAIKPAHRTLLTQPRLVRRENFDENDTGEG